MKRENIEKVMSWVTSEMRSKEPEARWLGKDDLNRVCKELDVPISYLQSHSLISIFKGACYLGGGGDVKIIEGIETHPV